MYKGQHKKVNISWKMKQEDEKKSNGRKRGVEHTTWGMGQPKMSGGATT